MHKQKGLSFWGFVWAAAFLICVTIVAVRSIPPYMNNKKLNAALHALTEERNIMTESRIQLLRKLKRRLNIDYADSYVDLDNAFVVRNERGVRHMSINYEVVVPLVANAALLFDFQNEVQVDRNPT
jgi:hypothetical protein